MATVPPPFPVTTTTSTIITSSTGFWVLAILGGLALGGWAVANYARRSVPPPGGTPPTNQPLIAPPAWAFVVLVGITTVHWLVWAVWPESWSPWYNSTAFWPTNVAIGLAIFFASRGGAAAGWITFLLVSVVVTTVSIELYGKWEKYDAGEKSRAEVERQAAIRRGEYPCPARLERTLTKEWSDRLQAPAGCRFIVERSRWVGYEVLATTPNGGENLKQYPPPKKGGTYVPPYLPSGGVSFRLRIMEKEKETALPVTIVIYRYR